MKILLAQTAGFCMGVRRAMEIAVKAPSEHNGPIHTMGPLIHNEQVIQLLNSRGVQCADQPPDTGTVILRAHGVPPSEKEDLQDRNLRLVDATCPHVLTSQRRIAQDSASGHSVVLVGDPNHPEVKGLAGHAQVDLYQISTRDEAKEVSPSTPFIVIAQTTFKQDLYRDICDVLTQRFPDCKIYDSICAATEDRQEEAKHLAQQCDAFVVVGGKHSSNTKRLAEIGREYGRQTIHVETAEELDPAAFRDVQSVAVTAGASTPSWITQAVIDRLEQFGNRTSLESIWLALSFCARARILTAAGAAGLTYSIATLMRATPLPAAAYFLCCFFVFFAYTVNRGTAVGKEHEEHIPVDQFFERHRVFLGICATISFFLCIACAFWLGFPVLALVSAGLLIASVYAVPILPHRLVYKRLKDIPASKDLMVACAWAVVIIGVISLSSGVQHSLLALFSCACFLFIMIFSQTIILDLRDIESDQIIGKETLPVLIGRKMSLILLHGGFAVCALLLVIFSLASSGGIDITFSLFLVILPAYALLTLTLMTRIQFRTDVGCQLLVDSQLLLSGVLATLWSLQ